MSRDMKLKGTDFHATLNIILRLGYDVRRRRTMKNKLDGLHCLRVEMHVTVLFGKGVPQASAFRQFSALWFCCLLGLRCLGLSGFKV